MQKKYLALAIVLIGIVAVSFVFYAVNELSDITQRNETQESVKNTIDSFNGNLTSVILTEGKYYSFVLDNNLDIILAHPREELINTPPTGLNSADISIRNIMDRLDQFGSIWIHYEFYNPETLNVDPKTAYLVKHGEYVFGAGFYSP